MGSAKEAAKVVRSIQLDKLRIDGGTQLRDAIDETAVDDYAACIDALPDAVAFHDGNSIWLADGFHRYLAHRKDGRDEMRCEVREGTVRDAILYAAKSNAKHGVRRGQADKRKAVLTLLSDPEWAKWSDVRIAQECQVHATTVGRIRKESAASSPLQCGGEPTESERTYVTKHGTEATMKTGNLRRRPSPSEPKQREPQPEVLEVEAVTQVLQVDAVELIQAESDLPQAREVASIEPTEPEQPLPREVDAIGLPLTDEQAAYFVGQRNKAEEVAKLIRRVRQLVHELAVPEPAWLYHGRLAHKQATHGLRHYSLELDAFLRNLEAAMPHCSVCPYCLRDAGARFDPECNVCRGFGWVSESAWTSAPRDYREVVEALRTGES